MINPLFKSQFALWRLALAKASLLCAPKGKAQTKAPKAKATDQRKALAYNIYRDLQARASKARARMNTALAFIKECNADHRKIEQDVTRGALHRLRKGHGMLLRPVCGPVFAQRGINHRAPDPSYHGQEVWATTRFKQDLLPVKAIGKGVSPKALQSDLPKPPKPPRPPKRKSRQAMQRDLIIESVPLRGNKK